MLKVSLHHAFGKSAREGSLVVPHVVHRSEEFRLGIRFENIAERATRRYFAPQFFRKVHRQNEHLGGRGIGRSQRGPH